MMKGKNMIEMIYLIIYDKVNKQDIIDLLKEYNQEEVEKFASYSIRLFLDDKNAFMKTKKAHK